MRTEKPFLLLRHIRSQPRLTFAMGVGIALYFFLPGEWRLATRLLAAWDSVTGIYLALVAWMMHCSTTTHMRKRAVEEDETRVVALFLAVGAAIASLAAIVAELSIAKSPETEAWPHIALAVGTVFLSWSFLQVIFALHYAHEFYQRSGSAAHAGGLEFPGHKKTPDYWDFLYHAMVIGTSTATADVDISSDRIRRITTLHCVTAFFFNTTILALAVNIGAGLF